jgi:formiminotetrahydrofolate cyclodeaminase
VGESRVPGADATVRAWAEAIAAPAATPAGGAAAALSAGLAAAAVEMVAGMTLARERYAALHQRAADAVSRAGRLREELLSLARRDAEAFAAFGHALALPRGTEGERASRERAKETALRAAAGVQLGLLRHLAELADLAADLAEHGLASALGDAATAGFLAAGAARSAYWAARSDLQGVSGDADTRRSLAEGLALLERVEAAEWRVRQLVNQRIR